MATFESYSNRYRNVLMERKTGILQITLHTNGGTLQWGKTVHQELPEAFRDIGSDPDNRVVIMTGAGDAFSGPVMPSEYRPRRTAREWYDLCQGIKHRLNNLLNIEVPIISAINGPAPRHSELPLLCDIVLVGEEATFQDSAHFSEGLVPGDGMDIVYPLLLGLNRGRYFLLTGQTITAHQALELGLVNEVLPKEALLPRAWALAEQLAQRPPLVLRYSRILLTQQLRHLMHDMLGYGLALEGLGTMEDRVTQGRDVDGQRES